MGPLASFTTMPTGPVACDDAAILEAWGARSPAAADDVGDAAAWPPAHVTPRLPMNQRRSQKGARQHLGRYRPHASDLWPQAREKKFGKPAGTWS